MCAPLRAASTFYLVSCVPPSGLHVAPSWLCVRYPAGCMFAFLCCMCALQWAACTLSWLHVRSPVGRMCTLLGSLCATQRAAHLGSMPKPLPWKPSASGGVCVCVSTFSDTACMHSAHSQHYKQIHCWHQQLNFCLARAQYVILFHEARMVHIMCRELCTHDLPNSRR